MKAAMTCVGVAAVPAMSVCRCGSFWNGMAGGAFGAGASDRMRARSQKKELDADLKAGRIGNKECKLRHDRIEFGSLAY